MKHTHVLLVDKTIASLHTDMVSSSINKEKAAITQLAEELCSRVTPNWHVNTVQSILYSGKSHFVSIEDCEEEQVTVAKLRADFDSQVGNLAISFQEEASKLLTAITDSLNDVENMEFPDTSSETEQIDLLQLTYQVARYTEAAKTAEDDSVIPFWNGYFSEVGITVIGADGDIVSRPVSLDDVTNKYVGAMLLVDFD